MYSHSVREGWQGTVLSNPPSRNDGGAGEAMPNGDPPGGNETVAKKKKKMFFNN